MGELTMAVDWVAVGLGTVLSFFLGALWFSPVMFGVKWAAGVGIEIGEGAEQPVAALVTQFVGTFLLALLIGIAIANGALLFAALIAVTAGVLLSASDLFGQDSHYAAVVEGIFPIAMGVIMVLSHTIVGLFL